MAWVSNNLEQSLQDLRAEDMPMFLGEHELFRNRLEGSFSVKWFEGISGFGGTDRTTVANPTFLLFDGFHNEPTFPDAAVPLLNYTLAIDFGQRADFDSIWISDHDWNTIAATKLEIQIADDSAFTVRLETIFSVSGSPAFPSDGRKALLDLGNVGDPAPNFYTNVRYMRLVWTFPGGSPQVPRLSELVIGRRLQLSNGSLTPYGPDSEESGFDDLSSRSANVSRYVFFRARAKRAGKFVTENTDESQVLIDWWDAIKQATRSFVFIEFTKEDADDGIAVLSDRNDFEFPLLDSSNRRIDIPMFEIPPFIKIERGG